MSKHNLKLQFVATIIAVVILSALTTFAVRRERLIDTWRPVHYDVAIALNDQLTEITAAKADIDIVALKEFSVIDIDFGEIADRCR
jgi:hypothetical protein